MVGIAIGRRVFGLGAMALGAVEWAYGAFAPGWLPVPAHTPGYSLLAHAAAAVLIIGGLAISLPRVGAFAGLALAALFSAGMVIWELPQALAASAPWGAWQAVTESAAMACGGLLAYSLTPGVPGHRAGDLARVTFGVCLIVFGISHFAYARFTASMVPAWLPPSQLFWTYLTGLAQITAGVAIFSAVQARLAAILLTVMYAVFGLLVHLPLLLAKPVHDNWSENAINFTLLGAAWALADWEAKGRGRV